MAPSMIPLRLHTLMTERRKKNVSEILPNRELSRQALNQPFFLCFGFLLALCIVNLDSLRIGGMLHGLVFFSRSHNLVPTGEYRICRGCAYTPCFFFFRQPSARLENGVQALVTLFLPIARPRLDIGFTFANGERGASRSLWLNDAANRLETSSA